MANPVAEAFAKGKILGDEHRALEERAGIAKQVEDAQLGPFIPSLEATPTQYELERQDYARSKARDLYFGVQDLALRKALIAKQRECDRFNAATLQDQLRRAHQALGKAQSRAASLPWLWAGLLAALCVAVGADAFQLYGAIGGALVGFFAGQGVIADARTRRAHELRTAQEELGQEQETVREVGLQPNWFNASEEQTGERDADFDKESIIANYYAAKRTKDRSS